MCTLQEAMAYRLGFVSALALVRFCLIYRVEVRSQADLACTYLCHHRVYCPVCANMCGECPSTWLYTESKEFSAVFGSFPGQLPLAFHCLTDDGLRGYHQDPK